jgi:hypothetical protein
MIIKRHIPYHIARAFFILLNKIEFEAEPSIKLDWYQSLSIFLSRLYEHKC